MSQNVTLFEISPPPFPRRACPVSEYEAGIQSPLPFAGEGQGEGTPLTKTERFTPGKPFSDGPDGGMLVRLARPQGRA